MLSFMPSCSACFSVLFLFLLLLDDLLVAAVNAAVVVVACATLPALNLIPTLPPPPLFGRRPHAPTFRFSSFAFQLSIRPVFSYFV